MKKNSHYIGLALLLTFVCSAFQLDSHDGSRRFDHDNRPFGKYLYAVCTLSGDAVAVSCRDVDFNETGPRGGSIRAERKTRQNIDLELTCAPNASDDCVPAYPIIEGADFWVRGSSDASLPVEQSVLSGLPRHLPSAKTVHYRADVPGVIVIRATAPGNAVFAASQPIDIFLQVISKSDRTPPCLVLPLATAAPRKPLDALEIVSLLGNPTPFSLTAQGASVIAVYTTRKPLADSEKAIYRNLKNNMNALARGSALSFGIDPPEKSFTVELSIPHAASLGDLSARLATLNFSQFNIQDVGAEKVRIKSSSQPDCSTWKSFLSDIRYLSWRLVSEPMSSRLFYLSASDLAAAFTSLAPAASAPSSTATASAAGQATSNVSNSAAANGSANISVSQPLGSNLHISSDTTPCVYAGLATGNSNACAPGSSASAANGSSASAPPANVTPAAKAPLGMAALAANSAAGEQTLPDLVVFNGANPGDDAQVSERLRILAQLDLPRPEMIITAWIMQNSSTTDAALGAFSGMTKTMISEYNRQFENVMLRGWERLRVESLRPDFFNESFRRYISNRFVSDSFEATKPGMTAQQLSQAFLDHSQAQLVDPVTPPGRAGLGLCPRNQYCLGYSSIFEPLKPRLTDLLLTIIAAQDPVTAKNNAVAEVEGTTGYLTVVNDCDTLAPEDKQKCHDVWHTLNLDNVSASAGANCTERDFQGILQSWLFDGHEPRLHLRCFAQITDNLLQSNGLQPHAVGLLRGALADFLFNYKMSQQYPHEFDAYELSQSANTLNSALSPIIDAFNRDLWSYQMFVRADLQRRVNRLNSKNGPHCCIKQIFGVDKPSFFNDGLVTVRTISGQPTSVGTTSSSSLNASTAPELSSLLNALTSSGSATPGTNSPATAVFGANPVKRFTALASALAQYQTSYAQIGRSLTLVASPRSLSTASAAEISVTLNADDSANTPLYTGAGASDPNFNTSHVAQHDTSTRVRVDSIKLFELSSFSAIVQRSRSRFPLLPPFVEIPYIGTFAGVPIGAAKEFHSSIAVLSAYVIPTAADIAYGLNFGSDLVVDGLNPGPCSFTKGVAGPKAPDACLFRKALSLHDVDSQPVRNFNKEMVRCFAADTSSGGCAAKTFDHVSNVYQP